MKHQTVREKHKAELEVRNRLIYRQSKTMTYEEIAPLHGMTRQRVGQIVSEMRAKL